MGSLHRMAVLCGLTVLLATATAQAEDWQVAKEKEGIKVSLSEVAGSKYKAYRGVTVMKTTMAKLRALQEDVPGACAWIHECKSQKLLKHEGDKSWTYTQFNTPWPVTPRDSVLEVTTEEGADGSLTRKLKGVPTYLPEEQGFVRVAQVDGFWKFTPKGADQIEVVYQVHTEPGGDVPSWLANKFVVDAPFNTLKALKERAEK
ncbi:START domain-containing protein [Pseudomonas sp. NFACC15-1]|uniref:START domain-containing protein n=1 Tax=unclassified Pseudomonas TaxID=196821 RepID=UPI000892412F|nr:MULTISPECIES: START domain-containing protein [unclassified Pseudomonas]SCY70176.1 START domain-containing protein [Pseudomonas sp. NFACC37-1]SDA92370.1 START domain-containing protein [Pseudomonas sp. NFACC15-1]SDB50023.1 START domain-containing protein [Pseudomonas sp. NFACC13-1]SDZ06653.1 START domain-containing protein [Pseudomonas sp. NFACC14]SFO37163.1 START domain-containing protein [Pseudomonas sp. NFACC24-1]